MSSKNRGPSNLRLIGLFGKSQLRYICNMKISKTLLSVLIVIVLFVGFQFAKDFYMQPSVDGGEDIHNFSAVLADGSEFQMSDLKGNYVLLDFWGSWCGPCIAEMPQIKGLYENFKETKFKNGGSFTVVSVAVEKDEGRWRRALDRFQMPWPYQVLDQATSLRFFDSPIAAKYGVKQVPTKILIDENGKVISVDQPVEEIAAFLKDKSDL